MKLDERALRLRAALGFLTLEPRERELRLLHGWLDSWSGIGHVVAGMARQGWDLQLTEYDAERWRATFFAARPAHSAVGGTAWETTPWRTVQRAACDTLTKQEVSE